ncbi:alpha-protein kinase 2 isoform X3 [Kogia breviceps]|uniref:alpha-protein kinase 2 isoform X3 n=1 Tax=Kogia breviceps TaxID=27615 RepID=UPI0034D1FBEE
MRQTEEACGPDNTEDIAEGLLCSDSSTIPDKQDVCGHRTVHSKLSRLMDGALDTNGPNEGGLNSSHQNPKVQKYISLSLPLMEAASSTSPGDRATSKNPVSRPASRRGFDSDYELCSEISLTCTEEFSDNDLEYLECSDVMTDHSNAIWQRDLQGTERVFLLESDDEEMEFGECCPGGCENFLSEMGCEPLVADDTGPMDATAGLCGYRLPSQGGEVRSSLASVHSASSPQTGVTLPVGPHQDGTSVVTDKGRDKPPTAPEAAEDGYPGTQGETRDGHQAGKEFASDNLLNMDKAVTERERKHLYGELGKSGMNQCLETVAEKRLGGKDLLSRRGSEKPARARRPGIKGKAKKLNPNLEERATEASLNRLYPRGPVKHPLTPSDRRESSHAKAEATDLNSHAGGCAIPAQAEQEAKILQTPPGSLSKEGNLDLQGEGVWVKNVLETSSVPDWRDHPQVQIQETVREQISLSRMPAFSEPTGEESAFTMTTIDSFSNLGGIDTKNASAQHLEVERCTQGSRHEENQDGEDSTPGCPRGDLGCELSILEANSENMPPCEPSAPLPQENSADPGETRAPSLASPELVHTVPTLETACAGPRDRVTACFLGRPEAGDQEACDTVSSPVGAPAGKYLPQEMCSMDFELAGQSKVSDLCSSDDKALNVLSQTQGSELPQSTYGSSSERTSAVFPLFISTLTWNISQKASRGAAGENVSKVEGSTSTLASMVKAGQERLSPSHSGGLEERQPLSSENDSLERSKEGGDESSSSGALVTADTPASHSSTAKFPQEKPTTLIANLECFEVTGESEDTSTVTIATKGHPPKYLPVSVAGSSHVGGPDESLSRAPDDNMSRLPSNAQLGHILNGSTTESSKGLACVAPSGPGIHVHVPQLPEGEDFGSNSPLQIDNQSGKKSQTVHRADTRSLEENFQEKGSETTQRVQQVSLGENFQESLPTTSAVQGEINLVLSDHSPANSREGREQSSGLGTRVPMGAESTMEDDSQALSNVPSLSNTLRGESKESGPGYGEAGKKLKIITLEASISETWPPRQLTDSKCKESEPSLIPGRVWAVSDVLKADAAVPEPGPSEAASACSPRAESGSAIANNREIHKGEDLAGHANWSCLSSQCLSQPRLLESSVDPVDEKELCVTDLLSEASRTGRKENVNSVSQNQEESQLKMDRPAFFKQFLTCPKILESSVDPTDETSVEWARVETPEPSESTLGAIRVETPVLLKKIQAEMFPDHSGNVKLSCQFAEIHEDSTIWWMKDSKSIAQVQRRAGDGSAVSLAILQASQKDQGLYSCCIKNSFGKVATEFNLTTEVLKQLSSHPDVNVYEEIEFSQLIFRGDFLSDSYFGGRLRGQIATEELHFGEGVHRKAFRSKVMQGLTPVFKPGHACVLKVHNAVAYGTRNNDELIQRNYKLAAQECYVQNTARYYAKIYAAEAQPLEGFGEVPEIIPIFLIHRPENNIPYATVEEELIGEFVKYSIRDGKEINFLRRESEAGQKCCTFQHWVYQKTSGCLLVTDMQGVGMKLTDVGIATLAKGYKGFKGNCSMTFIDQFKALHQCNKYCKMLGLKSLQNNSQKQKKPSIGKSKIQPNCTTVKKMASGTPAEKKT